jgi:PAS domain S-box-containing protein
MPFVSNPGFLAAAFINCSAAFMLLVLYVLLVPGFPSRFFRYWMAGWTIYIFATALRISDLWNGGGTKIGLLQAGVSLLSVAVLFIAVLDLAGYESRLKYLWPFPLIALIGSTLAARAPLSTSLWGASVAQCALLIGGGFLLWRSRSAHQGVGRSLLAASLLLYGLHQVDLPDWDSQQLALFRHSVHGLLGIACGVAVAVLVLEAGRARSEHLNEKMRRLALITAETTQSLRMQETLSGILRHVMASLNASHGAIFLASGGLPAGSFSLRASSGFSERFPLQCPRVFMSESWVRDALEKGPRRISAGAFGEIKPPAWMESERLSTVVAVPIAGKDRPFGLLAVASGKRWNFGKDEGEFLVNVANLLGLAVENASLIEQAASSRRQWLDTFNSIDDLIFVHAEDGHIRRANRALAWHLGLEPDLIEGQSLKELLKQGETRWIVCPYCEGAAGKPEQVDPSFGGHFLVSTSKFHDSEGRSLGTIHVLKDFTERRQVESKYRTLFEKVHEGIFISTPEGRFLDFNDAFARMLGYERREDLLKMDIPSELYVDPEERQRLKRLLNEYGEVTDFEFRFRRRDGEIRIAHESSFVTRDDSGAIVAYQGFVLDLTEQKQAEMEIRRRNRELLALNAIADLLGGSSKLEHAMTRTVAKIAELFSADVAGVYLLEESTRTLKRAAQFGHRSDYGRKIGAVGISSALLDQVRQTHATLLSGSALALPEEFRELQRQEGVRVSQVVVLWAKDRITGALVIGCREMREFAPAELNLLGALGNQIAATIDKSRLLEETREAYNTLRATQEQLLQSEKMAAVGQLISGVAHELNNPLTAILGYSELLKSEEDLNGRGVDYLEKLNKQAQRTHRIVQNLLSFARQHKPERGTVQVNQVVEDTVALREYDLKINQIRIHRDLDPKLPEISADFHQLQQVCLNILNNAVDAVIESRREGEIWVRTSLADDRVRIEFTDNGPGVKNPHRVFDPFYTTKPIGKGTGLGLSICYGIVKEHGGEIQVHNGSTGGATFVVTLPVAPFTSPDEENPSTKHVDRGTVLR